MKVGPLVAAGVQVEGLGDWAEVVNGMGSDLAVGAAGKGVAGKRTGTGCIAGGLDTPAGSFGNVAAEGRSGSVAAHTEKHLIVPVR